ncbi:MAG: hypothetical protein IJU83_03835, partial [Clostridia bacterium]|nr:hypothetical protein [Clostridia bacterium]
DEYCIEFEKEEKLLRLFHNDDGVLTGETAEYPASKTLSFKEVPVDNDETLIFKGIKSGWCKLVKNTGEAVAETHFEGFSNLLFWRPDGAAMICMEPWTNLPDTVGENIDFREKRGIEPLKPNLERVIERKIIY